MFCLIYRKAPVQHQTFQQWQAEIRSWKAQANNTRDLLNNSRDQLNNTRDLLNNRRDQLNNTRDLLNDSRDQLNNTRDLLIKRRDQLNNTRCTVILAFYTEANVHFTIKQVLQIIHTSLAIKKFFHEKPSERHQRARVFMLRETGTNEL